jgi:hypothetical protein
MTCRCPACRSSLSPELESVFTDGRRSRPDELATGWSQELEVDRSSVAYVRWLQQSLNTILGSRLGIDGNAGSMTRSALREFQRRAGLTTDGLMGPQTEAALLRAGAAQPPQASAGSAAPASSASTPPNVDIVSVRGIQVARQIGPQLEALLAAAEADGVRLGGSGYRSVQRQIELRRKNCGASEYDIWRKPSSQCTPPTATPGKSMHEQGLAVDFRYNDAGIEDRSNPGYQWLARNAGRFGFINLPSEAWHWSINGR